MVIQYQGVAGILPDNDQSYFSLLEGVIDSVDPGAAMSITRGSSAYIFRLIPSTSIYIDSIIKQLTELNNLMGIHLEFSKSMKSIGTVHWTLSF